MFCPKCGKELKGNTKFCPKCGKELTNSHTNTQTNTNQNQSIQSIIKNIGNAFQSSKSNTQTVPDSKLKIAKYSILMGSIACAISILFSLGSFNIDGSPYTFASTDIPACYFVTFVGIIGALLVYLKKYRFNIITSVILLCLFSSVNKSVYASLDDYRRRYFSYGAAHTLILIGAIFSLIGSILVWVWKIDNQ